MQGSNGRTSLLWGAAAVGGFHAAMSLYWALGGRWLEGTVGATADRLQSGEIASATAVLLTAAALKSAVAVGPLLTRRWVGALAGVMRKLAIFAGLVLSIYGVVLTVVGLVSLTGVLGAPTNPEALRGHALLRDPLFAAWGLMLLGGLGLDTRIRPRVAPRMSLSDRNPATVTRPVPAGAIRPLVKENA